MTHRNKLYSYHMEEILMTSMKTSQAADVTPTDAHPANGDGTSQSTENGGVSGW
jgi:hypothetical protein